MTQAGQPDPLTANARRLMVGLLAVVLLVALVGCGGDESGAEADDAEAEETEQTRPEQGDADTTTREGEGGGLMQALAMTADHILSQPEPQAEVSGRPEVVPTARLSDTPGDPAYVSREQRVGGVDAPGVPETNREVVDVQTTEAPPTTQVPTVTDPTPVLTDSVIPVDAIGLQFTGGGGGGPFSSTNNSGEFAAEVLGSRGVGQSIVFVIDASGSMVDALPFVVHDLRRAVDNLLPQQSFTVIMFSGRGIYELPSQMVENAGADAEAQNPESQGEAAAEGEVDGAPEPEAGQTGQLRGPRLATPQLKNVFREWIGLENYQYATGGRGGVYAQAAIVRALSYEPQLVFLLSDNLTGGGMGATQHEIFQDELVRAISEANDAETPAIINTVQFLYPDPLVEAGLTGTMELIAEQSGGQYRFISAEDLNLR